MYSFNSNNKTNLYHILVLLTPVTTVIALFHLLKEGDFKTAWL